MLPPSFNEKPACCFTGHRARYLPDGGDERSAAVQQLKSILLHRVEEAINGGVTTFLSGGADGFDLFAAEAVLTRKAFYPNVRLVLALPSRTQSDGWSGALQARYRQMLAAADEVHYASDADNTALSMMTRNRYLVDHADCCMAYLTRSSGGTLYTYNYALDRGLPVYNLAEEFR